MTDTDLRTAAAAFEADLSEYCDGPLRDALRAALAQSEHNKKVDDWGATLPPQSDGWQPIETAPKDGTPILCGFPDNFHAQHGHFDDNTGKWGQLISFYYQPTHWMPLPAPPEATPAPTAAIEGASDGPALKCPNPDCHKGVIHYGSDADGWEHFQCETCHGTGEMP
jgi:hypothetical protein